MTIAPELREWIEIMLTKNASDLVLTQGQPPIIRVVGDLHKIEGPVQQSEDIWRLASTLLTPQQRQAFEQSNEMDCSFGIEKRARFRVNVFRQQGAVGMVLRMLPYQIPSLEELGVPEIIKKWLMVPHGILITTGPTGSGKSTSQASMIRFLNER